MCMVKVSISFPNNTQISVESEDPEVLPAMLAKVLRELPGDLVAASMSPGMSSGGQVYERHAVGVVSGLDAPALSGADMDRGGFAIGRGHGDSAEHTPERSAAGVWNATGSRSLPTG